uniref:Large ribosomal subunit protein bL21m n=1 Tax=Zea mays TaxID=4577 RepID=A0A804Q3G9_MAIZE
MASRRCLLRFLSIRLVPQRSQPLAPISTATRTLTSLSEALGSPAPRALASPRLYYPSRCHFATRSSGDEEKVAEAAEIGYKVLGPLGADDKPFKPYEPVFAVVQIGSHQFKVSNGDSIFTERLKFCDVNDKLVLNRVLMLGSQAQTVIGRPILPDAAVHAVVEEHALDAKVIIFKKKRRKNYRRTKGHRQELTKLRITNIEGIDKPEAAAVAT